MASRDKVLLHFAGAIEAVRLAEKAAAAKADLAGPLAFAAEAAATDAGKPGCPIPDDKLDGVIQAAGLFGLLSDRAAAGENPWWSARAACQDFRAALGLSARRTDPAARMPAIRGGARHPFADPPADPLF